MKRPQKFGNFTYFRYLCTQIVRLTMKKVYLISTIAIIMIGCLQVYNIYLQYKNYAQEQANYITTTLKSSIDEEYSFRSRRTYKPDTLGQQRCFFKVLKENEPAPKGQMIDLREYDVKLLKKQGLINSSDELILLASQDIQERKGNSLNIAILDTIFTRNLKAQYEHSIILVDKNKNVIKTVGTKNIPNYWVHSKDIAVNLANPRFVRVAVFITPSQFIIQSIWTLILSLLFVLIASMCIGYQLREIRNRDDLLRSRELTVNSIIHDLKTPINSIIALMGVIKLKITDEATKMLTGQITDKAKLLVHDIETILSTASDKPRIILNRGEVNIMEIIHQAKSDVDILYENKEHTINIDDGTKGNPIINADKMYLLNAIRNLIENAIKYADTGVIVNVSTQRNYNELQVCVSDNGWGISKKDQKMIFNQFYRVKHEHGPRGHGIGLALVKYVVELHGGHIIVNSELGKGSKFFFNIPSK